MMSSLGSHVVQLHPDKVISGQRSGN